MITSEKVITDNITSDDTISTSISIPITNKQTEQNKFCNSERNEPRYMIEYLVTLSVSLVFGCAGIHFGWTGPTLPKLLDPLQSPILITNPESAWISGFLQIGAILGPVIGYCLCDKFGRRFTLLSFTIPNLLSFIVFYFATKVWMLYLGRFLCGIAVGIAFVVVPVYISEISSPEIRGKLGIIYNITLGVGSLLEYCIVPYVSIKTNAIICFVIACIQAAILWFIPDTPYYYVMKNKSTEAERCLRFLRQKNCVSEELKQLEFGWNWQKEETKASSIFDIFKTKLNKHCLFIIFGLIFAQQFSGIVAVYAYAVLILKEVNAPISPELSTIILALLSVFYSVITALLIDRWGRRPLFILSSVLSTVPLVTIGIFYYLKSIGYSDISQISLIPLIGLIFFTFSFSIGLGSSPYIVASEIFATKFKATAGTILSIVGSILGFVVTKLYQMVSNEFGVEYGFFIFAICCVFSAVFGVVFLPETRGRSLEQIQTELKLSIASNRIQPNKNNENHIYQ